MKKRTDGEPNGERITPGRSMDSGLHMSSPGERLAEQLGSLRRCMDDAGVLVADGKELYDSNWMAKRAAKNIVTEFAGTANRLPDHFKETHPTVPWSEIRGLRNRVVHDYEATDTEIVWRVLAVEFVAIRNQLGL